MNKKLFSILFISSMIAGCSLNDGNKVKMINPLMGETILYADGTSVAADEQRIFTDLPDWSVVPILDGKMREYCLNYKVGISYTNNMYQEFVSDCAPKPLTIEWTAQEGVQCYRFYLSTNNKMENSKCFVTFDNFIKLEELFRGTNYYYQIDADYEDYVLRSKIFCFETENTIRTVEIPGAYNVRDIGGYYTKDGKYRIKQGMVYRGSNVDALPPEGTNKFLYGLGIKTDMDLRVDSVGRQYSPVSSKINFQAFVGPYYLGGGVGLDYPEQQKAFRDEIKMFVDPNNFPIYFHCAIGRDRTGTLALGLEGLLGLSEKDIYMDYEATAFGGGTDFGLHSQVNGVFKEMFEYMGSYGGTTYQESVTNYVKSLGVTDEDIAAIKANLLEEVK